MKFFYVQTIRMFHPQIRPAGAFQFRSELDENEIR